MVNTVSVMTKNASMMKLDLCVPVSIYIRASNNRKQSNFHNWAGREMLHEL